MGKNNLRWYFFIWTFHVTTVTSALEADQVYSLLSNRINVEVTLIKNEIKEMSKEFERQLQNLEQRLLKLDDNSGTKTEESGADSNKEIHENVPDLQEQENLKKQISIVLRAFKEEKMLLRSFKKQVSHTLEEFKTSVDIQFENMKVKEKWDSEEMANNISGTLAIQQEQITRLEDNQMINTNKLTRFEQQMESAKNAHLQLNERLETRKITYTSYVNSEQSPEPGDTIKFDGVLYSVGGGFDKSTGIFTCPETGVYLLAVTLVCVPSQGEAILTATLKVDSSTKMNMVSRSTKAGKYCSEGSNMAIVHLRKGQTVHVESYGNKAVVMKYMSTFSGALLYN